MNDSLETLRARLRELQSARAAGQLDDAAYETARRQLERELSERLLAADPPEGPAAPSAAPGQPPAGAAERPAAARAPRPSAGLLAGLCAAVLALAAGGYAITGTPGAVGLGPPPEGLVAQGEVPPTPEQIDALLQELATRMQDRPDDATGWTLLARAYASRGRFDDAIPAYRRALLLRGGNEPDLMADLADSLTAKNEGRFTDEARGLISRVLDQHPDHFKSLALAGSAAFDAGQFAEAIRLWSRLESGLPPDSALRERVGGSIAEARRALDGNAAGPAAASPPASASAGVGPSVATDAAVPSAAVPGASGAIAGGPSLSGEIRLDGALASRVRPDDTLFVLARPASGSRMPLAVLRRQVSDLPLRFTLDDSMAMAPNARLSQHAEVQVVARISRSGQAAPQSGDLTGESTVVAPGGPDVSVQIDQIVP